MLGIGLQNRAILGAKSALSEILNVFSAPPILVDGVYKFTDSSNFQNDVEIVNSRCYFSNSADNAVTINPMYQNANQEFSIGFKFRYVYSANIIPLIQLIEDGISSIQVRMINSNSLELRFSVLGADKLNYTLLSQNTLYDLFITFNNTTKNAKIWVDGTLSAEKTVVGGINLHDYMQICAGIATGSAEIMNVGYWDRVLIQSEIVAFSAFNTIPVNPKMYFPLDGSLKNTTSEDYAGVAVTPQYSSNGVIPYNYLNGFSFDELEIVPALLDGLTDANGNSIQYPAGSGIVAGLSYSYVIPENEDLNTIIPAGTYTFDDIDALVTSINILKEKVGYAIQSLIVKKKVTQD